MNWSDERYVRLYTRDTPDWLCLSFLAQGLFALLLRKVDRAGVLQLGKAGRRGIFVAIGHAHQAAMLDPALDELLTDGCIQLTDDHLLVRNFIEAQEAESSDAARARTYRERRRDHARAGVTRTVTRPIPVTLASQNVTPASQNVTGPSRETDATTSRDATVTPSQPSQPNQPSLPSQPSQPVGDGLAGLQTVAVQLGTAFGRDKPLGMGKDPQRTMGEFARWLTTIGVEATVAECVRLASEQGVQPSHLSWFVGWLETAPDAKLRKAAP